MRHPNGVTGRSLPLMWGLLTFVLGPAVGLAQRPAHPAEAKLPRYDTPHGTLFTDLSADEVRATRLVITKIYEEFFRTFPEFRRTAQNRQGQFFLYTRPYPEVDLNARRGGFTTNRRRVFIQISEHPSNGNWHLVQHEMFHEFEFTFIRGLAWLNEGLPEYFAEGMFTGDGYVLGLVPPERLSRLKQMINEDRQGSFKAWWTRNDPEFEGNNYLRAWSAAHFLMEAEGGKYRRQLQRFIYDTARSSAAENRQAMRRHFGDPDALEAAWRAYWLGLGDDPTARQRAVGTTRILTNFLARAYSQGQQFDDFNQFRLAAVEGRLKHHPDDWLPPGLLKRGLDLAQRSGSWSLTQEGLQLVLTQKDGVKITGSFDVRAGRVWAVRAAVDGSPAD